MSEESSFLFAIKPRVAFSFLFGILLLSSVMTNAPSILLGPGSAAAAGTTILGLDCGLGSTQAVPDPSSGIPVADGVLDSACNWAGDVDGDGFFDPLVSDDPPFLPPVTGGGFTLDVRVTGLTEVSGGTWAINGFDISLDYDVRYLNAVAIDQTGLVFGGAVQPCFTSSPSPTCSIFTAARSIDKSAGHIRVAQVLLGTGTGGRTDTLVDETLFRVRFDVVGIGIGSLSVSNDILTSPDAVPHKTQSGAMDSSSVYDLISGTNLGWNVSWTLSPDPEVPGQPLTLTGTALCLGCLGSLAYSWDTDDDGTGDAFGSTAVITSPPTIVHRVTLTVTNGTLTVEAVRRLPLTVSVVGPSTLAVGSSQSWDGLWLGGIPAYTGNWRFCPGIAADTRVCSQPAPAIASTSGQTNLVPAVIYNYAGLYTNTLKITETLSQQTCTLPSPPACQATSATQSFLVNVTGTPQAFAVLVNPSPSNSLINQNITFSVSTKYEGDSAVVYDTNSDGNYGSGEPVLAGVAPPIGSSTKDDPRIKFTDSNANGVRDGSERVFYDVDDNGVFDSTDATITGTTGSVVGDDPRIRFVDANGNNGYDALTSYPFSFRSTNFEYFFDFGDGTNATATGSTASRTKSYNTTGTYTVTVTARETSAAAVSKIKEVGRLTITVFPVIAPDFTFDIATPTSGESVTFTSSVTGGVPPLTFTWDFGDGTTATGQTVSHTYTASGTYTVKVTVTDAAGNSETFSRTLQVSAAPLNTYLYIGLGAAGVIAAAALFLVFRKRRVRVKITGTFP